MSEFHNWVGTICSVLGLVAEFWIVLMMRKEEKRPSYDRRVWPYVVAMIVVAIVAVPPGLIAYKVWFGPSQFNTTGGAQMPLSADNARLQIYKWEAPKPEGGKQYTVNAHVKNDGRAVAIGFLHTESMSISSGLVPENTLVGIFAMLRATIALSPPSDQEISPGQDNVWYTNFGQEIDDKTAQALLGGSAVVYSLMLLKYRDGTTPPNKSIYTETCIYFLQGITHYCETGHNKAYVAD
jgi:hypothetical protein